MIKRHCINGRFGGFGLACVLGTVLLLAAPMAQGGARAQERGQDAKATKGLFTVQMRSVTDLKAVFATVRSSDEVPARARISGTLVKLSVDEGSEVTQGQVIGTIADEKLSIRLQATNARIKAAQARHDNAKTELDRAKRLKKRGIIAQAKLDQLATAFNVAANDLKSAKAESSVIQEQKGEGAVVAPANGRVLKVPVTKGSVVMPGETVAVIAANKFILRLELPERHARFIKKGDAITVGNRGLSVEQGAAGRGEITQVYPELRQGRVIADAKVEDLGDYFVGERAVVWISAGERQAFVIPNGYSFKRYGLDYVKLAGDGGGTVEIVVQLGRTATLSKAGDAVEVLAGLRPGDRLVRP